MGERRQKKEDEGVKHKVIPQENITIPDNEQRPESTCAPRLGEINGVKGQIKENKFKMVVAAEQPVAVVRTNKILTTKRIRGGEICASHVLKGKNQMALSIRLLKKNNERRKIKRAEE